MGTKALQEYEIGHGLLLVPAVAILFAAPFALIELFDSGFRFVGPMYPFLPFWISLFCIPGYVAAWRSVRLRISTTSCYRAWSILSVAVSAICALVSAGFAAFTIIGGILALWAGIAASLLLYKLLKNKPKGMGEWGCTQPNQLNGAVPRTLKKR